MNHQEFNFILHDTKFFGQYFEPKKVNTIVVLVHGMGEHSSRYTKNIIPQLNKANISVITFDHFGHGKTEGKRGHNPSFDKVLDSVEFIINKAKELFGNKPTFLYGHSMGGNVVINYVLQRDNDLKGVISTSPFLKLAFEPPVWKLKIAKALLNIAPSLTMSSGLDIEAISRDREIVKAYNNDPLTHDRISPNFSLVFIETGDWAIKNAAKLDIPMLLMHGTDDRLTNYKGSEEFVKNSGKNVEIKLWKGAYHELHNDIIKEEVISKVLKWINNHLT